MRNEIYCTEASSRFQNALVDLRRTLSNWRNLAADAYTDLLRRYRGSVLGPFWLIIGTIAFALGFVVIGGIIFNVDRATYIVYLLAGVISWQFIMNCLAEGAGLYVSEQTALVSHNHPIAAYPTKLVLRQILVYAHSFPIMAGAAAIWGTLSWNALWFIPGFALVIATIWPVVFLAAAIGTRFRDVQQLIMVSFQFLIFMTPVYWPKEPVIESDFSFILWLNPLFHVIELLREPFLGRVPALESWLALGGVCVSVWILFALTFPHLRTRIVFWL